MDNFKVLSDAVIKGDIKIALVETQKALGAGSNVNDILNKGLIATMDVIGEQFSKGLIFVPQMLRSAKAMQECTELLKPYFQEGDVTTKGKVLIGTVKGDLHDIGKNLVCMMFKGGGFKVIDASIDVPAEKFIELVKEHNADILGCSALLTTTMPAIKEVVEAMKAAGADAKIIIGGAPVTLAYCDEIGADGYAPDAASAVDVGKALL